MSTPRDSFAEPYRALGCAIEEAFKRAHHAEAAFAEIAAEHIERAHLHEQFDLRELARWVLTTSELPHQHDPAGDFGQPPVTLWAGRHFFVSALVWRSSTTTLHQHAFTGAFQVLHGSSLHARYSFDAQAWCNDHFGFGTLTCDAAQRLSKGDIRKIERGPHGIHSLFHLQHPSVSLVVRTYRDPSFPIQYDYYAPGIAYVDRSQDVNHQRARQIARMLVRCEPQASFDILAESFAGLPASDLFAHLSHLMSMGHTGLSLQLLNALAARFEGHAPSVEAALRQLERQSFVTTRRDNVRDPELRYFLAILLNAPSRRHVLELTRMSAPERAPEDTISDWLVALTKVTLKLQTAGIPWEPNVFGLPEPDPASLDALRAALTGKPVSTDAPFYKAVRHDRVFAPLFSEQ